MAAVAALLIDSDRAAQLLKAEMAKWLLAARRSDVRSIFSHFTITDDMDDLLEHFDDLSELDGRSDIMAARDAKMPGRPCSLYWYIRGVNLECQNWAAGQARQYEADHGIAWPSVDFARDTQRATATLAMWMEVAALLASRRDLYDAFEPLVTSLPGYYSDGHWQQTGMHAAQMWLTRHIW